MERTGRTRLGASPAPARRQDNRLPIDWDAYSGTGMTPDMQVLYERARAKRQVR